MWGREHVPPRKELRVSPRVWLMSFPQLARQDGDAKADLELSISPISLNGLNTSR